MNLIDTYSCMQIFGQMACFVDFLSENKLTHSLQTSARFNAPITVYFQKMWPVQKLWYPLQI